MNRKFIAGLVLIAISILALGGCSDLDKYRKPAQKQPAAEPEVKSLDIRGTPQEQEHGRQFTERLDAVRAELASKHDTTGALASLDQLLVESDTQRQALAPGSEFGTFYLVMMADILNEIALLRRSIGDEQGAKIAEAQLAEIAKMLSH